MTRSAALLGTAAGAQPTASWWSAAFFIVVAFVGGVLLTAVLKRVARVTFADLAGASMPRQFVAKLGLSVAFVLLPTVATSLTFSAPLDRFGWSGDDMGRSIAMGALVGAVAFGATIIGIAVLSRTAVRRNPAPARRILLLGGSSLVLWGAGAVIEEAIFRGYLLGHLADAWSFWPAAVLSSGVFAAIHFDRSTSPVLTMLSTGLVGLILCCSVRMFGAIWFAIAFHMVWNFLQSFAVGVNNSGKPPPACFSTWSFEGPDWITGARAGPEGSVVATAVLAAILWAMVSALPR